MFFRTPRFIRRWIRRQMHPMAERSAWSVKGKLSLLYMIIAWNCFGYVVYQMASGNKRWPVTHGIITEEEASIRPAYQWAKALGFTKAQVYRLDSQGLSGGEEVVFEKKNQNEDIITSDPSESEISNA